MLTHAEKTLRLARKMGVLRARQLAAHGIPRIALTRLERAGMIQRVGRGLYTVPGADVSEHHTLAEACKRVPHGVVCLLSALRFHRLGTQSPFEVWLAISRRARKPRLTYPPLRIVRFAGNALNRGIEEHDVDRVTVQVTSPARTVADCFRYRRKIGLDVAVEALRDYHQTRKGTTDELWEAAQVARVRMVIRPYMEAIV
jgi:predicted transcriptional regulator of viral defense system